MKEYVEVNEVVKILTNNQTYSATVLQAIIDRIPKADVEQVLHAHWKKECRSQIMFPDGEAAILIERQCSNCCHWSDKEILKYYLAPSPRCSVCGARMDEKENKE